MKPQTETLFSGRMAALRENRERLTGVQDKLYRETGDEMTIRDYVLRQARKFTPITKLEKLT